MNKDKKLLAATIAAFAVGGCQTAEPKTKVVVPSAATSAPEYEGDGSVPDQRYVIRMSDGERDWEVEFPSVATGYEMHIPLDEAKSKGPMDSINWQSENLTEADKELLGQLRREKSNMEREGVYVDGEHVNEGSDGQKKGKKKNLDVWSREQKGEQEPGSKSERSGAEAAPYRPSYLLGIEEVRRLYKIGKYELAMVRLKKLDEAYPDDEKILSMKGTLWLKLGREDLARKAWERVLQINPDNKQVVEALKRLNSSE